MEFMKPSEFKALKSSLLVVAPTDYEANGNLLPIRCQDILTLDTEGNQVTIKNTRGTKEPITIEFTDYLIIRGDATDDNLMQLVDGTKIDLTTNELI